MFPQASFLFLAACLVLCDGLFSVTEDDEGRLSPIYTPKPVDGDYPEAAAIFDINDDDFICSGSLINSQFVLTAASCFYIFFGFATPDMLYVKLGTVDNSGVKRMVKEIILHPDVRINLIPYIADNDVALLKLKRTVTFTLDIQPVSLAKEVPSRRQILYLPGWGIVRSGQTQAQRKLNHIETVRMPTDDCKKYYCENSTPYHVQDNTICTVLKYKSTRTGYCMFDSGAGLVYKHPKGHRHGQHSHHHVLVGVASGVFAWSNGNATCPPSHPNLFAKVAYHRRWILQNSKVTP